MHVRPKPQVVGEIPAHVIGIFVDHDLIRIPQPVAAVSDINRSDAEVEATEPESPGSAASESPNVLGPKPGSEMPLFPGMI